VRLFWTEKQKHNRIFTRILEENRHFKEDMRMDWIGVGSKPKGAVERFAPLLRIPDVPVSYLIPETR
jgi:hypothetical protein